MIKPYKRHVVVCGGSDCSERGGEELLTALKQAVKSRGLTGIKVTKTGCVGECEEGPHVLVYPDGVWYSGVGIEDVAPIVEEHLTGGQVVSGLVSYVLVRPDHV